MRAMLTRWLLRLVTVSVIVAALAYIPYRVYGSQGYVHYRSLKDQDAALVSGNAALKRENRALREEVSRLRDDLEAVGAVARDELGMVAPGELVLQIERGRTP